MIPAIDKTGPSVFLPEGEWGINGNTERFSVTVESLIDKEKKTMGNVLLLTHPSVVQIKFTGVDVERASIYASRVKNGIKLN